MALKLGPGEQIVFEGHPSWRSIMGFYAKATLILAAAVILVVLIGDAAGDGVGDAIVALILIAGAALIALIGFVRRVATRYTITNRRLNVKRGIIARDVQETRTERIQDVNYRQTVWQRLLQIGDVDFDTAAQDADGDFVFAGVAQPERVVARVHEATEPGAHGAGASGLGG